jgi:hypothetical protein
VTARTAVLWTGSIAVAVDVVDDLVQAFPAASTPELDRAVARAIGLSFDGYWRSVFLAPESEDAEVLRGVALSVEVDLRRGDTIVESGRLVAPVAGGAQGSFAWSALPAYSDVWRSPTEYDVEEQQRWSLRVRGTRDALLETWRTERCWLGEVVVSVAEAIRKGHARARAADDG